MGQFSRSRERGQGSARRKTRSPNAQRTLPVARHVKVDVRLDLTKQAVSFVGARELAQKPAHSTPHHTKPARAKQNKANKQKPNKRRDTTGNL